MGVLRTWFPLKVQFLSMQFPLQKTMCPLIKLSIFDTRVRRGIGKCCVRFNVVIFGEKLTESYFLATIKYLKLYEGELDK